MSYLRSRLIGRDVFDVASGVDVDEWNESRHYRWFRHHQSSCAQYSRYCSPLSPSCPMLRASTLPPVMPHWRHRADIVSDTLPAWPSLSLCSLTDPVASTSIVSVLPTPTSIGPSSTSPRGRKRSRSPEGYGDVSLDAGQGDDGTYLLSRRTGSCPWRQG